MSNLNTPYGLTCAHNNGVNARKSSKVSVPSHSGSSSTRWIISVFTNTKLICNKGRDWSANGK